MDKVTLVHSNFDQLDAILDGLHLAGVDGMLFDLGVSSPQLDDGERGFSYRTDAPLDMRMDRSEGLTAAQVVNTWPQEELRRILSQYGEERYAPTIAAAIVRRRQERPIETTLEPGGRDQERHARQSAEREAAPGQAELSGHPHRRQRRALLGGPDDPGRRAPAESGGDGWR